MERRPVTTEPDKSLIRESIQRLLRTQYFAVLTTSGEMFPYATLVGFAATEDLKHILFATMRNTRKHRNIELCNRVSLLIDNRTNRVEDLKHAQALTVLGTAGEARAESKRRFTSIYLERHPHLTDFVNDPNTSLINVEVQKYILVSRFQEVSELEIE